MPNSLDRIVLRHDLYKAALLHIRDLVETMPNIDYDADDNNKSPEDAVGHVSGLIYQCIQQALEEE